LLIIDGNFVNGVPIGLIKFVLFKLRVFQFNKLPQMKIVDGFNIVKDSDQWKLNENEKNELIQLWWKLKLMHAANNSKNTECLTFV